jgi:hypothetical protein
MYYTIIAVIEFPSVYSGEEDDPNDSGAIVESQFMGDAFDWLRSAL